MSLLTVTLVKICFIKTLIRVEDESRKVSVSSTELKLFSANFEQPNEYCFNLTNSSTCVIIGEAQIIKKKFKIHIHNRNKLCFLSLHITHDTLNTISLIVNCSLL